MRKTPTLKKASKKCCPEVKEVFCRHGHKKCTDNHDRNIAKVVKGRYLNEHLFHTGYGDLTNMPFSGRKHYSICHNLYRCICKASVDKDALSGKEYKDLSTRSTKNMIPEVTHLPPADRSTRLFLRNRIEVKDLKGIKTVNVIVDGKIDASVDVSSAKRMTNKEIYEQDVLRRFYKVPFERLVMRERNRRINEMAKHILSCCIDRGEFKQYGEDYYKMNKDLSVSIINLLDGIKDNLERRIGGLSFREFADEALLPIEEDK